MTARQNPDNTFTPKDRQPMAFLAPLLWRLQKRKGGVAAA
jgi:hypothetical protein